MISSDKKVVQTLIRTCLNAGMTHVVCSPGSRNSPIVIAMDEHPQMNCFVIHDERVAGFVALGMAQQLKALVGVVCTSGSAMLNYYPAVAEAYYQRIPLVVISADRPEKWINQGDGQTIVQQGVYQNHIEGEVQISESDDLQDVEERLTDLFLKGNGRSKGPIHINCALEEPLYNTAEIEDELISISKSSESIVLLNEAQIEIIKSGMGLSKKLIIIGQLPKNEALEKWLIEVSSDPSYAILLENTSNLNHQSWIHCIDRTLQLINEDELKDFAPDLLISMGGAIVSKRIKSFFRKHKPQMHWKVGFDFPEMNTFEVETTVFQVSEHRFLEKLSELNADYPSSNFGSKWKQLDFLAQERANNFMSIAPYSDLTVFDLILDTIPEHSHLHMGNSSVVRYCQLFNPIKSVRYYSNRGTSGIDGSTSTALGSALVNNDELHIFITGDVSFFYDSNALWNSYKIPNLRIILINNGGGGIFNIINGPRDSKQNTKYFEAKHGFIAKDLCACFNVEYFGANSLSSIENQLESFYTFNKDGGVKLLEINTRNIENHLILDEYFKALNTK